MLTRFNGDLLMEQLAYEEIDLRKYVRVLFKNRLWILAAVVVCAAAAMGASFAMSPML